MAVTLRNEIILSGFAKEKVFEKHVGNYIYLEVIITKGFSAKPLGSKYNKDMMKV